MPSSNCCFLTCIQISREAGQVVWYSHLFQNFPQFIVIHTVKGFGTVNKAETDAFLERPCFLHGPADVGGLTFSSWGGLWRPSLAAFACAACLHLCDENVGQLWSLCSASRPQDFVYNWKFVPSDYPLPPNHQSVRCIYELGFKTSSLLWTSSWLTLLYQFQVYNIMIWYFYRLHTIESYYNIIDCIPTPYEFFF